MSEFPRDYELLVLDDGSTDETEDVLAPYARVLPLTVLQNERTQGYAASLERLIREAVSRARYPRRDVVVALQADFTEAPEDIPALVKRIEGGADVVGSTADRNGDSNGRRSIRWLRTAFSWLMRRTPVTNTVLDPFSGFRAYRISVLKRALAECNGEPLLSRDGWAANAELLLSVAPHTRRVEGADVGIRHERRQRETRFRPWNTVVDLWDLARHARRTAPALASPEP